jgi:hypothetical protein
MWGSHVSTFQRKKIFYLNLLVHIVFRYSNIENTVENRKTLCSQVGGNFVYH